MIEIIEKRKQEKFTRECEKCGCKYSYELEDITAGMETECPECKHMNFHYIQPCKKAAPKKTTKKEVKEWKQLK